ncbi:arginine--tRNA ligase [Paenibacillus aurantius]|uniref:Arginine--tRNA ligase n=1 Tax=Paenibacillus aurantius TaxID=2918900 RepID=A0AA96RH42_9BACL|nr:arginine--tRNA ligase [Paenibacillus aurantius]WNQ10739.1 arginine--tRNA ligase [Paenibacillus aurantius]
MIHQSLRAALEGIAEQLLQEAGQAMPSDLGFVVEHPVSGQHGEYSTNLAMKLARHLKKNPMLLAEEIRTRLAAQELLQPWVQRTEAAAPGFVNVYIHWERWMAAFEEPPAEKPNHRKVLIEHTSINPNKAAHIGHLRNSCIGDTLARMLRSKGHLVEVHNYIDDLGNQLADTVVGLLQTSVQGEYSRFGDFCWDVYADINRQYREQPELEQKRAQVLHELEEGGNRTAWLGLLTAERIVQDHLEDMRAFGIDYDVLVWESAIVREGFWEETFRMLQTTSHFRQETEGKLAGCWVLKPKEGEGPSAEESEFQTDKVLVRSNGILTYTAKDIAYHLWKFGLLPKTFRYRPFAEDVWSTDRQGEEQDFGRAEVVVNVIDHRQEYPQQMVKQALQALGYREQAGELHHVGYGVVSLSRATAQLLGVDTADGKASYPMSGRQGIGIKVADLVARMESVIDAKRPQSEGLDSRTIAAAAIRYYLLKFHLQTEVVFDLEQATEVTGNTGVYLMYSYARACSLLDKAGQNLPSQGGELPAEGLSPEEHALMKHLLYWRETMELAVKELSPNLLCTYAYELAMLYNQFYGACPILKAEENVKRFRLWLTAQYRGTLYEVLSILGLPAPSRM